MAYCFLQKKNLYETWFSNNIVFKIPVMRSRPDIYSTLVAVIQNEIKSGIEEKKTGTTVVPENPTNEIGKVEDDQDEADDDEEDCLRIIEETMVDPKSLPGRKNILKQGFLNFFIFWVAKKLFQKISWTSKNLSLISYGSHVAVLFQLFIDFLRKTN